MLPAGVDPKDARPWYRRPRFLAFVTGCALSFVCPYLPGPLPGVCRVVSAAMRTGTFDGAAIPLE